MTFFPPSSFTHILYAPSWQPVTIPIRETDFLYLVVCLLVYLFLHNVNSLQISNRSGITVSLSEMYVIYQFFNNFGWINKTICQKNHNLQTWSKHLDLFPVDLCSTLDITISHLDACMQQDHTTIFCFQVYIYNAFIMSPKFLGFLSV